MSRKDHLIDKFLRFLALGVVVCGGIIIYSGVSFLTQISQPFRENLGALSETITELNRIVLELRKQSDGIDAYLGVLQGSLGDTKSNLREINATTGVFLEQTGGSSVKLLNDAAASVTNASRAIRELSNHAGSIPLDPLADERQTLYELASNFTTSADDLKTAATNLKGQTQAFRKLISSSVGTTVQVVGATQEQVAILRKGPVERIPVVLEALSQQLSAHVKLIDASYGLLNKISQPVIAVGAGFVFLGLRGLFMRGPDGYKMERTPDL